MSVPKPLPLGRTSPEPDISVDASIPATVPQFGLISAELADTVLSAANVSDKTALEQCILWEFCIATEEWRALSHEPKVSR